jgi:glycerol-1-phosphate dehydrogenase [NAD(P)+]
MDIEIRFGTDLVSEIAERYALYENPAILFTQSPQWDRHGAAFGDAGIEIRPSENLITVPGVDGAQLENMGERALGAARALDRSEVVLIGFGGGQCSDAAKYAAWYLEQGEHDGAFDGVTCIEVPSVVSVDAFLCEAVAVREGGRVRYLAGRNPDAVFVDFGIICEAPKRFNRSGVADCLSIYTALFDWKLSSELTGERYDEEVAAQSRAIIDDLLAVEGEIRDVTPEGVRAIVEGYVREVDLCTTWGNSRPEEGSEHFFAYNYEYLCTRDDRARHILHGELVGLGLFIQSSAQAALRVESERAAAIVDIMNRLGLNWTPGAVDTEMVKKTMKTLRSYCEEEDLPFSVSNTFDYPDDFCDRMLVEIDKERRIDRSG